MTVYHNGFEDWKEVQEQFEMDEPQPFKVLYASYDQEYYEGSAEVLYQNEDGTFGYVEGSHCSCFGLEGQWAPEVYTSEQLLGQVDRATYGFFKDNADMIRSAVESVK